VLNSGVFGFYFNDMEGGISSVISKAVEYNEKKLDLNSQNNIELSIKKFSVECMMKKYIELLD